MREFAILIQLILLRPASADTASAPAIGLIAPVADLQGHVSFSGAATWLSQHLPSGLALLLPLMAVFMLQALIRKRPLPGAPAAFRDRVPAFPRRSNQLSPGTRHTAKDDRTASSPVI